MPAGKGEGVLWGILLVPGSTLQMYSFGVKSFFPGNFFFSEKNKKEKPFPLRIGG
jgi:hypothetical protein